MFCNSLPQADTFKSQVKYNSSGDRPSLTIELLLAAWIVIGVIYSALHLRSRHRRLALERETHDRAKWLEPLKKCLEIASGFMLVLGALVFANAVDLRATGLNNFAVLYENESRQLGSNTAAIAELRKQLASLRAANEALNRKSIPPDVGAFVAATDALIDALWQVEQGKPSQNDSVSYAPNEDPLPNLMVSLPAPPAPASESHGPEINMHLLLRLSELSDLQRKAEATERDAEEIRKSRDDELIHLGYSISLALEREQRLTPPEKAKLFEAIAQRIAALVARDGVGRSTQEIRDLAMQKQQEATGQRQTNNAHVAAKYEPPAIAFLPGSPRLKSYTTFIVDMTRADGVHCGGASAAMGHVIEKPFTADLEITGQDGTLYSDPRGTHYHVKLTQNETGEALPNGGFRMDVPDNLVLTGDQAAKSCSTRPDGERCVPSPFNIIWTDDSYPTRDNPKLRPTVYCFWPAPRIM